MAKNDLINGLLIRALKKGGVIPPLFLNNLQFIYKTSNNIVI